MKEKKFFRRCPNPNNNPKCKNIIGYIHEDIIKRAEISNTLYGSCRMNSPETKSKISSTMKGSNQTQSRFLGL